MTVARTHLGDAHNFGRRVAQRGERIFKPRTRVWEWLVLSVKSPLRVLLRDAAKSDGARDAFSFLPDLTFHPSPGDDGDRQGGEVERLVLSPLPKLSRDERRSFARVVGRCIALFSWLGVSDLHWENLALGVDRRGEIIFSPLDVETILADMARPTETKLLPDADPEVADICRHAAGVRRALPYLGKPIDVDDLVAMAAAYLHTLALLDRHARAIADVFASLSTLKKAPIRVLLRGTDEYVHARTEPIWPPLLDAESEQLARGDIPYFFRLYGTRGIHYFVDASLQRIGTLPTRGDVPQLEPLLSISRGLQSSNRSRLHDEGLFTLLGAFDDKSFTGGHTVDDLSVTFRARTLVVTSADGEELQSKRDLRAFVGSVYLNCRCGEVRTVFVPAVTRCSSLDP